MVSQITLGNIYQQGGKTVVGGGQTGFDTESIIKSLVEVKRLPAVQIETENKTIDKKQAAFAELKKVLETFRSAADVLRNPPGVDNDDKNIFQYRTATLASSTSTSADTFLSVTTKPGAAVQDFVISNIQQLAKEAKQFTGNFSLPNTTTASAVTASATAGFFKAGTITLDGIDGQADVNVTLDAGDSLQEVVNKFNAVKNISGMQASIVTVATGSPNNTYKINFTGTKTGLDYDFDFNDTVGGVGSKVVADASGVLSNVTFAAQTQAGQNAIMVVDGITINRPTNGIDGVIEGVTFNLKKETSGATLAVSVDADTDIVAKAVTAFADAYNEFKLFQSRQNARNDDGSPTEDAVLSNDTTLRTMIDSISSEVTRVVAGITSGNPNRLSDLGITFDTFAGDDKNPETKNIMVIDADALKSKLASDFDAVRKVFEFQMTADDPNLTVFSRTNGLSASSFTVSINRSTNTYTATVGGSTVTLGYSALASGGVTLTAPEGSALAGLKLIYSSSSDATIAVKATQGTADRLFNALDGMLDEEDGTLTIAIDSLTTQETDNKEEIDKIDEIVSKYRDQITEQYSQLESALSKANNLLALLDAQANARNNA